MIRIEHKKLSEISENYFEQISPIINRRINFYIDLFNVLFTGGDLDDLYDSDGLRWNAKISLINNFLSQNKLNFKSNDRVQYNRIILDNVSPFVFEYESTIEDLLYFLKNNENLRAILLCSPEDSLEVDLLVRQNFNIVDKKKNIVLWNWIGSIIDYDLFDEFAYHIANELEVNTCPYCNRNYINTVIDKEKKLIRPQFDHFFPKSEQPFLALSFYNLIPSCYYCNSSLKSATTITHDTHLHPYVSGFSEACVFGFEYEALKKPVRHPENFTVKLLPGVNDDTPIFRKIFGLKEQEGNARLFRIKEIYHAAHRDILGEMKERTDRFSSAQADSISSFFKELQTDKSEFFQFYFGNYMKEMDFNRRPMAKFTRDIVRQMIPDFFTSK